MRAERAAYSESVLFLTQQCLLVNVQIRYYVDRDSYAQIELMKIGFKWKAMYINFQNTQSTYFNYVIFYTGVAQRSVSMLINIYNTYILNKIYYLLLLVVSKVQISTLYMHIYVHT